MTRSVAAAIAATFILSPIAFAKTSTVTVQFDKNMNSKEYSSSISGSNDISYVLQAGAGQVMQVLFSSQKGSCYVNVFEPGNDSEAVFNGSVSGNEFGASPTKAGAYRFNVYQTRATARRNETCRYKISFELTGGTAGAATPAGPSEVAKGACLYKFGSDADIVQVSPLKPGYWEIIMKAKSGKRKAACTVNDDGTIADWVEMK